MVKISPEALRVLIWFANKANLTDPLDIKARDAAHDAALEALSTTTAPSAAVMRAIELLTRHRDNCDIGRAEHLELGSLIASLRARQTP